MRRPRARVLALALPVAVGLAAATPALGATVTSFAPIGVAVRTVALDPSGNVFTGSNGDRTVSKAPPLGGSAGAPWPIGPFADVNPAKIVIDAEGNIFTASAGYANTVAKFTPDGAPAGGPWPVTVGANPANIAIDADGNLYTANVVGQSVTKITPGGTATLFATLPPASNPVALAFDRDSNLYTANEAASTVAKFTPAGAPAGAPWPVSLPGAGPRGITVDSRGNVYTANWGSNQVSRITPEGAVTTFNMDICPSAVIVDSANNVYVAHEWSPSFVNKITPAGTTTVAFANGGGMNYVHALAIDRGGNIYVPNGGSVDLSKITPDAGDIAPAPPARPAAPAATAGNATATISVPANPVDARYGEPSSYTVAAVEDPSKSCTVTPPATSCTVNGLANGTAYRFTARASLNAWETGASSASAAVTPSALAPSAPPSLAPGPAAKPKKLGGTFRLNTKTRVGTTTGTVPPGATVMVQTAGAGGGASGSVITQGFLEMAKARTAKGKCRITTVRNKKTKKVTKRTYTCTIRLAKGTWTVTTTARGKAGVVAEGSRKVVVK